jgi:hypothetical protein
MKLAVVALILLSITGCDSILGSNKERVSIECINHANAIATDAELGMMRTGYGGASDIIINVNNCRYYFFNPDAKNGIGMRKEEIKACEDLRPEFHAAAVQLKQQALSICLSMK